MIKLVRLTNIFKKRVFKDKKGHEYIILNRKKRPIKRQTGSNVYELK